MRKITGVDGAQASLVSLLNKTNQVRLMVAFNKEEETHSRIGVYLLKSGLNLIILR